MRPSADEPQQLAEGAEGPGESLLPPAASSAAEGGDCVGAVAAEDQEQARRESEELVPVSLAALFSTDPECAAAKPKDKPVSRARPFAGAQLDDELELKKLQVFVRIRPSVTAGAPQWDAENCIHATSKYSIAIAPPDGSQAYKSGDRGQTYSFSRVFDAETSQFDYFDSTAAPMVRDLLRNKQHNSVMMAYGITAAGKTYTIEGTKDQPGVMPRALLMLFEGLSSHVEPIVARAAYYEVYNEQIYDLLDEHGFGPLGQRGALKLKEDAMGRVFVAGLSEVGVISASEALAVLKRGSRQRQRAETGLNYSSSRSHSIFTVTLYQQGLEVQPSDDASSASGDESEELGGGEEKLGRLSFVDLAGSERAQRTGNVGVRLKESVAINSSLMTLGRCLEALRWNQQHKGSSNLRVVPYRESKVTHLFRDALHGWGQVVLSVNVSPASKDYDETAHVLKYAALATQIGTIQQAEAPRRIIKAVSPAIKKVKRKAALPPEARRGQAGGGNKAKKPKKAAAAPGAVGGAGQQAPLGAIAEAAGAEAEASLELQVSEPELTGIAPAYVAVEQQHEEEEDDEQPWSPAGKLGVVSAADQVEDGLEEAYSVGTPTTPFEGDDEAAAALQAQVQQLIADLQQAEERCVLLEAEVREEVADEMAQLLHDMEESYRKRLEAEVEAMEKKQAAAGSAAAAAEASRRDKGRGGKAAKLGHTEASVVELATAREDAATAAAEAEQLQQQADGLADELEEAEQMLAELQGQAARQQADAADRAAALELAAAAAQQACATAQELLAVEQQRCAGLDTELAAARQQAAEAQACFQAERQRADGLEAEQAVARQQAAGAWTELATTQQQVAQLQAELGAAQQQAVEVQAELANAKQQAAQLQAELATVQHHAAQLGAEVAAAFQAADSGQQQASEQYEAQLQEAVVQIEANKCMEVEMVENQAERLRKDNLALQRRLQGALAALAAYGSPRAGPGGLAARIAQAAAEGNGRGAGGTPHDVALARARQAAAADDQAAAAAAAAAAGTSTAARSRSRFAEQAQATCVHSEEAALPAAADKLPSVLEGAEDEQQVVEAPAASGSHLVTQQDEQQHDMEDASAAAVSLQPVAAGEQRQQEEERKPGPGRRGKAKKAVAFAEVLLPAADAPAAQPAVEQQQVAAESRRARRMTRAACAALPAAGPVPVIEQEEDQQQQTEPAGKASAEPMLQQQARGRRGRRCTQAAAAGAETADKLEPAAPANAAAVPAEQLLHDQCEERNKQAPAAAQAASSVEVEAPEGPAELRPARKGRVPASGAAAPPSSRLDGDGGDGPPMATVTFQQPAAHLPAPVAADLPAPGGSAVVAKALHQRRRRGRPAGNKENEAAAAEPAIGTKMAAAPLATIAEAQAGAAEVEQAAAGPKQQQQPLQDKKQQAGGGGTRRKRLLPTQPLSVEMRAALGDIEDMSLRQHVAQRQAAATIAPEAAAKRSRRQTQFFRL